jgi:hypothetical protein
MKKINGMQIGKKEMYLEENGHYVVPDPQV